jgi:succinate dehydrogenase / fumarate reductase membrane anchor subunit
MVKQDTRELTRGLGPGKGGAHDFIAVRLNSLALMLLYAWLFTALFLLPDLSYPAVTGWLRHPLNAILMIALVVMTFWHVKYGLDELIDDYVHAPLNRTVAIGAMHVFVVLGGGFAVWSVVRIALSAG